VTTQRAILSVKYTAAPSPAIARKAVGGFLRYVQYRDHHKDSLSDAPAGLLKYVAHRDRAAVSGRLFERDGAAGDLQRRQLSAYVARSLSGLQNNSRRRERAVYRFVLSPEHAEGLDLRQLTRATMARLERDAGPLAPWIAAEHRNTAHPHVHIVMAARRELKPGQFRTVMITKPRLARMKDALNQELERQRDGRRVNRGLERMLRGVRSGDQKQPRRSRDRRRRHNKVLTGRGTYFRNDGHRQMSRVLRRMARQYQWEAERAAQSRTAELEWER
jgi:type IV secretory pathway VirD2 relaxase